MTDVGSGKVKTPVDRQMRPRFEVLREQFSQDRLLGEVLGPDHDTVLANPSAARQKSATERNEQSSEHVGSQPQPTCHPERSEGSAFSSLKTYKCRSFASLRMTGHGDFSHLQTPAPP
jgi:hypothetical protein